MWNLLDLPEIFISYLIILILLTALNVVFYRTQRKARQLEKLRILILIILLGSFAFHIIDSIPYLFISIYAFPIINIIRSTVILLLMMIEFILFQYSLYYRALAIIEEQKKNA